MQRLLLRKRVCELKVAWYPFTCFHVAKPEKPVNGCVIFNIAGGFVVGHGGACLTVAIQSIWSSSENGRVHPSEGGESAATGVFKEQSRPGQGKENEFNGGRLVECDD